MQVCLLMTSLSCKSDDNLPNSMSFHALGPSLLSSCKGECGVNDNLELLPVDEIEQVVEVCLTGNWYEGEALLL